jgi:hypothetical protein
VVDLRQIVQDRAVMGLAEELNSILEQIFAALEALGHPVTSQQVTSHSEEEHHG